MRAMLCVFVLFCELATAHVQGNSPIPEPEDVSRESREENEVSQNWINLVRELKPLPLPPADAAKIYIRLLKDHDHSVFAVNALASTGQNIIPEILKMTRNPDSAVREGALEALHRMGDASVAGLAEARRHPDKDVRQIANEVLRLLQPVVFSNIVNTEEAFAAHKNNPEKATEIFEKLCMFRAGLSDEQTQFILSAMKPKTGLPKLPSRRAYAGWGSSSFELAHTWIELEKKQEQKEILWPREMPEGLVMAANRVPNGWQKLRDKISTAHFLSLVGSNADEAINEDGRKMLFDSAQVLLDAKVIDTSLPMQVQQAAQALAVQVKHMGQEEVARVKSWAVAIFHDDQKSHKADNALAVLMSELIKRNPVFQEELQRLRNEILNPK